MLDEAVAAGYGELRLWPYGYMPLGLATVAVALRSRGLTIVAGAIFDNFMTPENRNSLVRPCLGIAHPVLRGLRQGVMCPIGRGIDNYRAIRDLLERIAYGGFITVEQERCLRNAAGSLADVKASRDYLQSIGF